MFDAGFFEDVDSLKKRWEERSKELLNEWESNPSAFNKKRIKAIEALSTQKRISDLEGREDFKYQVLTHKLEHLDMAGTPEEIEQILAEPKIDKLVRIPIHSLFWMIEEECLFWQRKSLEAPLDSDGFARYMKVFAAFCKKYGIENPLSADEDISDIPIFSLEDMRVVRNLLADKHGLKDERKSKKEKENPGLEQLLLF